MKATIRVDDGSRMMRYLERAKTDGRVAAARALNRTIRSVQTRAVRVIADNVGLPQRRVRGDMAILDARPAVLTATLIVKGRRIPLADFNARGPEPSRGKGRGVTYRIGRGGRRQSLSGGFLVTLRSGHRGVFVRAPGASAPSLRQRRRLRRGQTFSPRVARLPIQEKFGPSLPRVASQARVDEITREAAGTLLRKNLEHELRFLAQRGGAS